jgi:serine O-acetyltransferase
MFNVFKIAYQKDPALKKGLGYLEVFFYPGVQAVIIYRLAHLMHKLRIPLIPRALSYLGRILTGAEIHPAARIGKDFFIDHATGVVVGETAEIGNNVMIYHNVTLGGRGWWRDAKNEKRHPTIEDNVTLGVGATIIGPVTIGQNSVIGPFNVIAEDIPKNSTVIPPKGQLRIRESRKDQAKDPLYTKELDWII